MAGNRRRVDVHELLREVGQATRTDRVTIELALTGDAVVSGNQGSLARMFRNLLDNAVRYAANTVTITTDITPATVEIHIADDGPGIPAADRERVFDRFVRLDSSRDRTTGNSGLGLAIAREIATSHDGSIRIEDRPDTTDGRGADVVVRLPRHHD